MAIHIRSLGLFPTMKAAFDAHTRLLAAFKSAHKRAEKVDLFLSATPDGKQAEVRVHFTKEHEAEATWFIAASAAETKRS